MKKLQRNLFILVAFTFSLEYSYFNYVTTDLSIKIDLLKYQVSELQKAPITCTVAYPDGTIVTKGVRHDEECSGLKRITEKECNPFPECQTWPEINGEN